MEIIYNKIADPLFERCYGIDAILKNFKGCQHLEITLFRAGQTKEELEALRGKNLVGDPDPSVPPIVLQGATEEGALSYILENFTQDEVDQFLDYCQKRYSPLIEKIFISPLDIPVPFGTSALAGLPVTANSGFICFDLAPNYPLDFKVRAYFDFNLQDELQSENS